MRSSLYSPTRPAINQSRAGLSVYPGFASVGALIGALALFAGMGICTNITPPQREESPESRRLFGAVWGGRSAASTFSPSVLPAERPTRPMRPRKSAQRPRRQPRSPVPRSSFLVSPVPPSGSPQINAQTRSELAKADNCATSRERTNGDLDPAE